MLHQNDNRWKDKPLNGSQTITIGSHGCLLTSLCNIYNHHAQQQIYTPLSLDKKLKEIKGYTDGNLIIWSAIETVFNCKCIPWFTDNIDYSLRDYYIANFLHFGTGHFTNIVFADSKAVRIYDVWDDQEKLIDYPRRVVKVSFV